MEAVVAKRAHIEKLAEEVNARQRELAKAVGSLQALASQLSENQLVNEEMDMLDPEAKVYKLVGPVLMPQDLAEAKDVVGTRIKFIKGQVGEAESRAQELEKRLQTAKVQLVQEQQAFQQAAQAAARSIPPAGSR